MTERCADCRFVENTGYAYRCRRLPPTRVGHTQAEHPTVNGNDWCGEFEPRQQRPRGRRIEGPTFKWPDWLQ